MKLPPRRKIIFWIRFWLIFFVVINLVGAVIWHWALKQDAFLPQVVELLEEDPVVAARLGDIQSHKVTRLLIYEGTDSDPPYRQYHLNLRGSEDRGMIVVRVYPKDEGEKVERWEVVEWLPE